MSDSQSAQQSETSRSGCPFAGVADIEPFAPETLRAPHDFWAALRKEAPVFPVMLPGTSSRAYMVTRGATIERVALDPETFSNRRDPNVWRWPQQPPELARILTDGGGCQFAATWSTTDPPVYQRYRKVAMDTLSLFVVRTFGTTRGVD